jgi:AcrR family transcriptional regulator
VTTFATPRDLARGRTQQKLRTRTALVNAARELVAKGHAPTVEDAAAAAAISRTTAYRYFRNQAELLGAAHPETATQSLLPDPAPEDPETRLEIAVKEVTRIVLANEAQQRTMLRLSLDPSTRTGELPLRQGRVIGWLEDALAPLGSRLTRAERRRLVFAIRSAIGIEALVWLTDVAGLSREEAVKTMRWSARSLLRAALLEKGAR